MKHCLLYSPRFYAICSTVRLLIGMLRVIGVLLLAFADEAEHPPNLSSMTCNFRGVTSLALIVKALDRRLKSRCKGLLEIGSSKLQPPEDTLEQLCDHDTVQYLHRTVKDFVESPQIRRKFDDAIKSPFDVHLRFCGAHAMILKTTYHRGLDHVQQNTKAFFMHARVVSEPSVRQLLTYMDQIEELVGSVVKTMPAAADKLGFVGGEYLEHTFAAASYEPLELFGKHMLSAAVVCGILPYVQLKASSACLLVRPRKAMIGIGHRTQPVSDIVITPRRDDVHSLLVDACLPYDGPNCDVVKCLLEKGADPNRDLSALSSQYRHLGLSTPWEFLRSQAGDISMSHIARPSRWQSPRDLQVRFGRIIGSMIQMLHMGAGAFASQQRKQIIERLIKFSSPEVHQTDVNSPPKRDAKHAFEITSPKVREGVVSRLERWLSNEEPAIVLSLPRTFDKSDEERFARFKEMSKAIIREMDAD